MSEFITRITLRVDEELFNKIKVIATKEKRSANSQIEVAIENYINNYEKQYGTIEIEK